MKIYGLNKTTLLDYPGKVAATIFIGGCNFRCPFCHNSSLIFPDQTLPGIPQEDILAFLKKRRKIIEGVCVTGGEPTLHKELFNLLRKIRELDLSIKIDTNGSNPAFLKQLVKEGLADEIAMDIKSSPENYHILNGISNYELSAINESIAFLMEGNIEYEFRTTVVRELHTEKDFIQIGKWLSGAKAYYLQAYRDSEEVLQPGYSSFSKEELQHFRSILLQTIPLVEIRGID